MTASNTTPAAPRRIRRKLANADYQALGAFRGALRRFMAFSEEGSRSLGLTPQQHQALLAVRAHAGPGPISVGELAAALLIKNHSAVGLVERLVERGLLERSPSPQDRRRVVLALTALGEQKLEAISRSNLGQLQTSLPAFEDLLGALEQLDLPVAEPRAASAPAPQEPSAAPRRRRGKG